MDTTDVSAVVGEVGGSESVDPGVFNAADGDGFFGSFVCKMHLGRRFPRRRRRAGTYRGREQRNRCCRCSTDELGQYHRQSYTRIGLGRMRRLLNRQHLAFG